MFRKGGEVMEGIMTGIKPRKNYSDGKTREEIFAEAISGLTPAAQKYAQSMSQLAGLGRTSNQDLLTNVLIQGGLRGMSTAGKGGTLANLAAAFEAPVGQALKQRQANKMLDIQGAMKGLELGSKVDVAERKALKSKEFESGTLAAITKEVQNALGKDVIGEAAKIRAVNLAPKVAQARTAPNVFYQGILIMDKKDTTKPDLNYMASQPEGAVFLNPNNNLFYIKDDNKLKLVNQQTLRLDEGE